MAEARRHVHQRFVSADLPVSPPLPRRRGLRWLAAGLGIAALLLLGIGAFPVGVLRGLVASRVSAQLGTTVEIGALTRSPWFSYAPTITLRDVRIVQPAWAGPGDLLRLRAASFRVPLLALATGGFRPERIDIAGLDLDLVRAADKRANWRRAPDRPDAPAGTDAPRLGDLRITDARFRLRDFRRELDIAGPLALDGSGLRLSAAGQFLGTPATLTVRGAPVAGAGRTADYPLTAVLASPALHMTAAATLAGPLNLRRFRARIGAQAPTLKNLDRLIEAGLFGTQPIDLAADIRHVARDWQIDRISGTMGRSAFTGSASILKRDGRTKLDAKFHASRFDFDDLSDTEGLARAAALRARIGPRLIPATRINLAKLGRTDGRLAFTADRILTKSGPVVLDLRALLTLDRRRLTATGIDAALANGGRMTGSVGVDHREGAPKLSIDLHFAGASLERLVGRDDIVHGPIRGRVRLTGSGDTVREALARADGKIASGGTGGDIRATVAAVLGQDFGRALGQTISGPHKLIPMRCFVANFRATNGILTPDPLALETELSSGKGSGRIVLDGETIALSLAGWTDKPGGGRIDQPIRMYGTLSKPEFEIGGLAAGDRKAAVKGVIRGIGKLVGRALGISKAPPAPPRPPPLDCTAIIAAMR